MGQTAIENPVVIAKSGKAVFLVNVNQVNDPMTPAQRWHPQDGYGEVKPLGVWLKFLYYVESVEPPEPWNEPVN